MRHRLSPLTTFAVLLAAVLSMAQLNRIGVAQIVGTVPVTKGGTGTATAFTAGSAVYAGASGVYSQDNANFFWDATSHSLGIGTTNPNSQGNGSQARMLHVSGDGSQANADGRFILSNPKASPAANDEAGRVVWLMQNNGTPGTDQNVLGQIVPLAEGSGGANGFGGQLALWTKSDNSSGPTRRWNVDMTGDLLPQVDGTYNIGSAAARVLQVFSKILTANAGTGTGTFKASGMICDTVAASCSCGAFTDAATINQWNVIQCTLPASTLAANGDEITIDIPWNSAANANTKAYQMYWNGGTCSGTGAAMCASGTQIFSLSTAGSGTSQYHRVRVKRSSSGNQKIDELTLSANSTQDTFVTTAAVTDTNTIAIAWGVRNTSASAASVGAYTPMITVRYSGQ